MSHSWFYVACTPTVQIVWCQVCGCLKVDNQTSGAVSAPTMSTSYRKVGAYRWNDEEPKCNEATQTTGKESP